LTDLDQTFREHELLFTGANGFLGKVILALLLDRFPKFRHLHILLRPSGELTSAERFFKEVLNSPVLASVTPQEDNGFLRNRISIWSGDISAPDCGLKPEDLSRLVGRIDLILNCAGRVDFFPPIDDSFSSNVDGVENVVDLAKRLDAKLLHVSTAFACGEADGLIEESEPILGYYPHRRGPDDRSFDHREELRHVRELIRQIYESSGPDGREDRARRPRELIQRLVALGKQRATSWGWVNTYTYSKSLGEQIIQAAEGLDFAIVRPAIVESAWRFPFPGWIEGGRTAAPLVLMALGGLKDWPVREDAPLEVIPVDMVASAILTISALLLQKRHAQVYQLGSADVNPVTLGSIVTLLDGEARKRRNGVEAWSRALTDWLAGMRRGSRVRFVSSEEAQNRRLKLRKQIARTERWLSGTGRVLEKLGLPGERWMGSFNSELRKLDLQAKFREQTLDQYLPFVLQNRYIFECENIRVARSMLSKADQELLPWHPEKINWREYWTRNQIEGIESWVQPEVVREWTFKI
jgi:long-chain acyl-CoA synthetase